MKFRPRLSLSHSVHDDEVSSIELNKACKPEKRTEEDHKPFRVVNLFHFLGVVLAVKAASSEKDDFRYPNTLSKKTSERSRKDGGKKKKKKRKSKTNKRKLISLDVVSLLDDSFSTADESMSQDDTSFFGDDDISLRSERSGTDQSTRSARSIRFADEEENGELAQIREYEVESSSKNKKIKRKKKNAQNTRFEI